MGGRRQLPTMAEQRDPALAMPVAADPEGERSLQDRVRLAGPDVADGDACPKQAFQERKARDAQPDLADRWQARVCGVGIVGRGREGHDPVLALEPDAEPGSLQRRGRVVLDDHREGLARLEHMGGAIGPLETHPGHPYPAPTAGDQLVDALYLAGHQGRLTRAHLGQVASDHGRGSAPLPDAAVVEPDAIGAELLNGLERVRDHDQGAPLGAHAGDAVVAAPLESLVADGQDLVDDQDVRVEVHGDREAQPSVHPRGVGPHRVVDEALKLAELDDLVDDVVDVAAGQPQQGAVQVDVLATGVLGMEAGAQLEQGGDAPMGLDAARVGIEDPGDALEQRGLARAVLPDDAESPSVLDLEAHVLEGKELLVDATLALEQGLLQGQVAAVVDAEALGDVAYPDRDRHHSSSANRRESRLKRATPAPSTSRLTAAA